MRYPAIVAIVATSLATCAREDAPAPSPALIGFTSDGTIEQRRIEQRFKDGVTPQSISDLHRPLAQRPHPAGSQATAALVKHLERTLTDFGLDVKVHEYHAHLSRPVSVRITQIGPTRRDIRIDEPAIAADPTSSHPELGGGYIAYSASGNATGELVEVGYGLPADYEALKTKGISTSGKIALARYGKSHRAVKVHTAQQEGARALILYSNPKDDGPQKGPAWPDGYWRGGDMLQRGNAKLSWFWHGDPLTPGVAAKPQVDRVPPNRAPTLPRIPVAVISANEAARLRTTANPRVSVRVEMDDGLRPIYNVVASVPGRDYPNRRIMLGTHHDAWTFGGVDPGTGMAALLEVAKGVGAMAKSGWRPSRSIDFAFWDAEEFGLIGSTEYVEEFRAMLQEQLILYVNTDMYMKGRFDAGGVPSLRDFVTEVVGERSIPWKSLGSGADFVPFQDHLGVPSLSVEYIGANGYGFGTYHSNYDSRAYVEKVADPGFEQGVQMARVLGVLALRMSSASVLPFRFADYAERLKQAVAEAGSWAHDAKIPIDVEAWLKRVKQIETAAVELETTIDGRLASGGSADFTALNDRLARLEQQLADDSGAEATKWYRHVFYGWNIYSLYDGQMFPGLAEALRVRDAARVTQEIERIDRALDRMHAELAAALRDVR
jgi:N-acetylated-alpha-linked acidic dipeptidase